MPSKQTGQHLASDRLESDCTVAPTMFDDRTARCKQNVSSLCFPCRACMPVCLLTGFGKQCSNSALFDGMFAVSPCSLVGNVCRWAAQAAQQTLSIAEWFASNHSQQITRDDLQRETERSKAHVFTTSQVVFERENLPNGPAIAESDRRLRCIVNQHSLAAQNRSNETNLRRSKVSRPCPAVEGRDEVSSLKCVRYG